MSSPLIGIVQPALIDQDFIQILHTHFFQAVAAMQNQEQDQKVQLPGSDTEDLLHQRGVQPLLLLAEVEDVDELEEVESETRGKLLMTMTRHGPEPEMVMRKRKQEQQHQKNLIQKILE